MGRPQTRNRRNVVLSSDESSSPSNTSKEQSKLAQACRQSSDLAFRGTPVEPEHDTTPPKWSASPASTLNATPKKPFGSKPKGKVNQENGTRTLHMFFDKTSKQSRQQAHQSHEINSVFQKENERELLDIIEDDFSDCASSGKPRNTNRSVSAGSFGKRSWTEANENQNKQGLSAGVQKFLKASNGQRAAAKPELLSKPVQKDFRPWTEKYAPRNLDELAVHHKKVSDVSAVLNGTLNSKSYHKLIVLKGPAGTGKTSTVSLLSKALKYETIEWRNPTRSDFDSENYVSVSSQFEDFISRAGKFGGLAMTEVGKDAKSDAAKSVDDQSTRKVLLIEDFPNFFGRSNSLLQNFRSQILSHLVTNGSSEIPNLFGTNNGAHASPIVMVISESYLSNGNSAENFTAHRLLGQEILRHPGTIVIDFNPVAPTLISKALNLVNQRYCQETTSAHSLSPHVAKRLAETGDVRNATSTLEFLYSQGTLAHDAVSKDPSTTSRKRHSKTKGQKSKNLPSAEESSTLSLIALREGTLGLFHAVGKVMYNKRNQEAPRDAVSPDGERPPPDFDLDILLDSTGTDCSTFLSTVHENYTLSCFSSDDDSEKTLDSIVESIVSLSDSDVLINNPIGGDGRSKNYNASAGEDVRQEELAFHVGTRGVMKALPWPVKRQAVAGSKFRGDAFKMFYPADLKLRRQREELCDIIDFLANRAQSGHLILKPQGGRHDENLGSAVLDEDKDSNYLSIASGQSARIAMTLERLPFLSKISAHSKTSLPVTLRREMEQVTRFTGIGVSQDDASDEENDGPGARRTGNSGMGKDKDSVFSSSFKIQDSSADMEKLVLSDDDIEDD